MMLFKEPSSIPQLATKFTPPQLPATLTHRERLLSRLDEAYAYRLALLSASAGSGKTTLLSMWAARVHAASQILAWISLDMLDNDPTRFWTTCISAIGTHLPALGETTLHLLHTPQPAPIQAILTLLINEIQHQKHEVILVLDDYHTIEEQAIHEGITFLLDYLPTNLHLVLASRTDPDLPLSRWRTRGQLLELRDEEVSFTQEETEGFLSQTLGPLVRPEEVQLLQRRTEGWIAGIQLAALAWRTHNDRSHFFQQFTGTHRYLMDYVQQEILAQQPAALHHFLLQIAVLTRMNADLCQVVTEVSESQELLETLERNHLFVIPLDAERRWYRLHDLFREVLLARLHTHHPALVPLLHQRAASWYHAQGLFQEAISHALASQPLSFAAALMEQGAVQAVFNAGELKTLGVWAAALPPDVLCLHPNLACWFALSHLAMVNETSGEQRVAGLTHLDRMITLIERALTGELFLSLPASDQERLVQRFHLMKKWQQLNQAFLNDDAAAFLAQSEDIQHVLAESSGDALAWRLPAIECLMLSFPFLGDLEPVRMALLEAKRLAVQERTHYATLKLMGWLEYLYLEAGQLQQAYEECLEGDALIEQVGDYLPIIGHLENLADLHYRWNRLSEAERYLRQALQHAGAHDDNDLLVWGYCHLVDLLLARSDIDGAEQALQEAQRLVRHRRSTFFAFMDPWVTVAQIHLILAQGDLIAAADWAVQVERAETATSINRHHKERLALARVRLAQQQYSEAIRILEPLQTSAENGRRGWPLIEVLALKVAALHLIGEVALARELLIRLLKLTEPEGALRVYLDTGSPMRQALRALLSHQRTQPRTISMSLLSHAQLMLAAFTHEGQKEESKKERGLVRLAHDIPGSTSHTIAPFEPLSAQEQRVLRLLVAGRSNQEIANTLVVSVNTVKTQIQSIYRKLGVTNRTEASMVSRHLGLF